MSYDIDEFVNTNKANVFFDDSDEVAGEREFEMKFKFDKVNTKASPVYVYECNTKAVAWYDSEMNMGFVQK
jgi:hypothetical protein